VASAGPALVSVDSIALAFAFSAAIGIFFGFWPVRKAAQLDPIEAPRHRQPTLLWTGALK